MTAVQTLFRRYVWPHKLSFFGGGVFLALTNYLSVSIPEQIGLAIDSLSLEQSLVHIKYIALMGIAIIVVRTLSRVLFFNPGRDVEYNIRKDLFAHLLALQPSFYAKHNRGDIISRASSDISWVRVMIGFGGLQSVNITFALLLTGWKMISISLYLFLLTLCPILLGSIFVQLMVRSWYGLMRKNQEEVAAISEHVLESLQGVATIQSFVAKDAFSREFTRRNEQWFETGLRLTVLRAATIPIIAMVGGGSVFLLIYVGGPMVQSGEISVGNIATFIALIAGFLPYMRSLGWLFTVWQRGMVALERIFELLNAEVERPEGDNGIALAEGTAPQIDLRGLSFGYPDEPSRLVLEDISFSIQSGEMIGIFGQTGSGKSTLLRLLARLYNPKEGQVLIDGKDICTLDLASWRRKLSMVPQRPFLFGDSIRANIALDDDAPMDKINWAIRLASLEQDLEALPDGLSTVVGERGIMLSGGQRQRVALARGLYQGGDLILLDDVLSAVDHENEQQLIEALANLSGTSSRPTCVIVSNRISAFRHADRIIVLEDGRVTTSGTHLDLISQGGLYQEAYLSQKEEA